MWCETTNVAIRAICQPCTNIGFNLDDLMTQVEQTTERKVLQSYE